jgi:hypothetical protein
VRACGSEPPTTTTIERVPIMAKVSIRVEGFKCVGRNGNEYHFVTSVFDHGDGFAGVTGLIIRPVCADEYNSWDFEAVAEYLEECGLHEGKTCKEYMAFVNEAINIDGIEHIIFDESEGCNASAFFDALDVEHECTDCIGGGRIFNGDSDYEEIYDHAAWVGIRALEGGTGPFDFAAKAIFGSEALCKGYREAIKKTEKYLNDRGVNV